MKTKERSAIKKAVLLLCLVLLFTLTACEGTTEASCGQSNVPTSGAAPNSVGNTQPGRMQKEQDTSAKTGSTSVAGQPTKQNPEEVTENVRSIKMTISGTDFTVVLEDNETAREFAKLLPLTLEMEELHGNEKFNDMPQSLPTNPVNPGQIQTGDLMLFGRNCLVLFYETFSSPYSYTKIGSVKEAEALAGVVGSGGISANLFAE